MRALRIIRKRTRRLYCPVLSCRVACESCSLARTVWILNCWARGVCRSVWQEAASAAAARRAARRQARQQQQQPLASPGTPLLPPSASSRGAAPSAASSSSAIGRSVCETNPLLEAFGNAQVYPLRILPTNTFARSAWELNCLVFCVWYGISLGV